MVSGGGSYIQIDVYVMFLVFRFWLFWLDGLEGLGWRNCDGKSTFGWMDRSVPLHYILRACSNPSPSPFFLQISN